LPPSHFIASFQPALASFQYEALPLVIIAILTPDRLLLPIAPWIFVVRACNDASLNEEEPTIEEAPPLDADGDAAADVAGADAEALLLVAAGAVVLLLDELEQAVRASSAPAPTPIAVANFLCTDNLLVAVWNYKGMPR
jgi:hypothetical protein